PDAVRATARHEGSLSFDVLASRARPLLAPGGRMAVILPSDSDERTIASATLRGIYPRRHCRVSTRRDLPPVRSLWEFGTDDGACESTTLVLRDKKNDFSPEYKLLTQEFHIFL
ncbi:MAG: hypothetical protein K2F72_08075, partial [Muribaculaceae bacterium]|nr:hypothetical protein [Muribaculaceae bacterium]